MSSPLHVPTLSVKAATGVAGSVVLACQMYDSLCVKLKASVTAYSQDDIVKEIVWLVHPKGRHTATRWWAAWYAALALTSSISSFPAPPTYVKTISMLESRSRPRFQAAVCL